MGLEPGRAEQPCPLCRCGAWFVKTTACFRDVVRQKYPGIEESWILHLMADMPFGAWCRRQSQPSVPTVPHTP